MKLFISYSRADEAIVHLLAHILEINGVKCLYDRQLPPAEVFTTSLQEMINEADLILLLLTKSAASSAWVNQELGFAAALKKPVWPLAMERDIQPQGWISAAQSYLLFDWSDSERTISKLVEALKRYPLHRLNPYKASGLQQVIQGSIPRTRFIVDRFRELQQSRAKGIAVYNQAAFSIFSASNEMLYQEEVSRPGEYVELLLEERRILCELIQEKRILLKLILWPVRAYDSKFLAVRYGHLLDWMKSTVENENVTYVLAQYVGPNRYIIENEFCLEGYKLHHTSGYQMSLVHYDESRIATALGEFNAIFEQANHSKVATVSKIQEMYEKVSTLPNT